MIFHITHSRKPSTFGIFFSELFGRNRASMIPSDQMPQVNSNKSQLTRKKLFFTSKKRSLAFFCHKAVILAKRQKSWEIRKQKLENYRIDYLPMGWESDFE